MSIALGRPARVTFSATHVVAVRIRGETPPEHLVPVNPQLGPLPRLPVDDGLVGRFVDWTHKEGIFTAFPGGVLGGGMHIGFYTVADAERIAEWLRQQGVEELDYEDQP